MSALARLEAVLATRPAWAIAVSGGVDSMTLAQVAHRAAREAGRALPLIIHAHSPAVPGDARAVIAAQAAREGWRLEIIAADELADPNYRANPVNRCYFCKSALYRGMLAALAGRTDRVLASGANLDDLGDYRPGLAAAAEAGVVHPLVEAGIDKAMVRALARSEGLGAVAEAPAQPCLASRIETGIAIEPADLAFIDALEGALRPLAGPAATLRVRLRAQGVAVESDAAPAALAAAAEAACRAAGRRFLGIVPYRRGSAFLGKPEAVA